MENKITTQLINSLFSLNSNSINSKEAVISQIENDDIIPELIDFLSTKATREQINDICAALKSNFDCLRMNVIRFIKGYNGDLFKILFDLYLKYEDNPISSIIDLLEVLLLSGSNEKMTFNWLYTEISYLIREDIITPSYICNYLELLRLFYNLEPSDNKDNCISQSYFYFYPHKESKYCFIMKFEEWKDLSMNGFGVSIWFKLPFKNDNIVCLFKDNIGIISFDLAKITFSNNKSIIIRIDLCQSKKSSQIIVYIDDSNWKSIQHTDIDQLTHLYVQIDKTGFSLYLNKQDQVIKIASSIVLSNQVNSLSLFKNFFGEVHSVVIYSVNVNQNKEIIKDILIDYNVFAYNFLNSSKPPVNALLVYFPFANGHNIWNNYNEKKEPSFLFSSNSSPYQGGYCYYPAKDTISKYYGTVCLLPIIEYIYLYRHNSEYIKHKNMILKLFDIIPYKKSDIDNNFSNEDFFWVFSMFLEKMPNEYISEALGKKLYDLYFVFLSEESPIYDVYLNSILLNEKLIQKYPVKFDIYKQINILQNGTTNKILTLKFLIQFLLYIDKTKFNEYCCEKHQMAFNSEFIGNKNIPKAIMKPCLSDRIDSLASIIVEQINYQQTKSERTREDSINKQEAINDFIYLTQLLYLDSSPCLTIKILDMIKKVIKNYNQDIFTNLCYSLLSPFRDIKNQCLKLIIYLVENKIFPKNNGNTVFRLSLLNYIKVNLIASKQEISSPSFFSNEYTTHEIITTFNHLIQFVLNDQSAEAEQIILIIIDILKSVNTKSEDNYLYLGLFIDLLNANWQDSEFQCKLSQFFNDSFSFHQYLLSVLSLLSRSKHNKALESVSSKCLKFYLELIFSSPELFNIMETIFNIILENLKESFSSNSNKIMNYHYTIHHIIQELFSLIKSQKINSNQYSECIISIFKFYNSIENLKNSIEKNTALPNKIALFQKPLMLYEELGMRFYEDIVDYFSFYWDKEEYKIDTSEFFEFRKSLESIDNFPKVKILYDEIELFTSVNSQKEDKLPLIVMISLMYNTLLNNNNVSNKILQLIKQYQRFLCFTIILSFVLSKDQNSYSIICSYNNEQKSIQTFLFEALIIGFNCLMKKISDLYEVFGMIFSCFDEKQYLQWKKATNKIPIKKLASAIVKILCLISESEVESMKNTFPESQDAMNFLFQENTSKSIETLSSQIKLFYQSSYCIIDNINNDNKKKLKWNIFNDEECGMNIEHQQRKEEIKKDFNKKQKEYYLAERKNKLKYKKIKKYLFSWNKPWSNRVLFYPNESDAKNKLSNHKGLKVKLYNYYTQSFTRPFVVPIIDIDYYFPEIANLNLKKIFNDNDNYDEIKVDVNIDRIISQNIDDINQTQDSNNDDNLDNNTSKLQPQSISKTNCLFELFKVINNENNDYRGEEVLTSDIRKISEEIPKDKSLSSLCCLVKPSHHIKGILRLRKDLKYLEFKSFIDQVDQSNSHHNKEIQIELDYDQNKQACFGSFLKYHPKDSFKDLYIFSIESITYLILKKYYFRHTAMEIFTSYHKSYYFNFISETKRDKFYQLLKSKLNNQAVIIDFESKKNNYVNLKKEDWKNWKISNLHFLMLLNMAGNRSFNDLTQYPVVPWILCDYSSDNLKSQNNNIYRDLTKPMGMLELSDDDRTTLRKNEYIDNYHSFDKPDENEEAESPFSKPYFFGSHYSNPIYTAHFLLRIFPLTEVLIELHDGKLDDPNRLFTSVETSFNGATTQKGDVRELIPEFYFLGDMFINSNNLNLGISRNKVKVDNVFCPQWANNNPFDFVMKMRQFLENDTVSYNLHSWIDLIFGVKQRGDEARDANNLFMPITYSNIIQINENTSKQDKEYYYRLVEFGIIPKQVFTSSLEQRKLKQEPNSTNSILLTFLPNHLKQEKNNNYFKTKLSNENANNNSPSKSFVTKLKCISSNKLYLIRNNNEVECIKYNVTNNNFTIKSESNSIFGLNIIKSPLFLNNKMKKYKIGEMAPLLIYDKGDALIQGGFHEGLVISTPNGQIVRTIFKSPLSYLTINKEETIIIAGAMNGTIGLIDWSANFSKTLQCRKRLFDHTKEVKHIFLSNELNAFVSCARDNYVHLYTFPKGRMIRSFYINQCEYVFLSDSPLPSIIIYSSEKGEFICYSINGYYLRNVIEDNAIGKRLHSPQVIKNSLFFDYLIYIRGNQEIIIRDIPYMNIFKVINFENSINCYDVEVETKLLITYSEKEKMFQFIRDILKTDSNTTNSNNSLNKK